ncbi:hypothetical protein EYF80_002045 [Liparis tanakae]|uniref:Uncharacterized protein n=1 Tax=Liparis tanakae TaxID=230148 RepID=A0A4Z2JDG7_9TELE|nr:hypothetical protein EYF80_002045 [Liparis tanakae]
MVRLALRSGDMTATCAVPPGNPTSQTTGGWRALLHAGNSGLVQRVFSSAKDRRDIGKEMTGDRECACAAL